MYVANNKIMHATTTGTLVKLLFWRHCIHIIFSSIAHTSCLAGTFCPGAVGYYETSALTGEGVEEAMTYCIRVAAGMETRSRRFGLPRAQRR